jgi:hypothetical protein
VAQFAVEDAGARIKAGGKPIMVYIDPLRACQRSKRWPFPTACHLFADDDEQLFRFARRLGLQMRWFQAGKRLRHFDLTAGMRIKALRMGAREVELGFVDAFMKRNAEKPYSYDYREPSELVSGWERR